MLKQTTLLWLLVGSQKLATMTIPMLVNREGKNISHSNKASRLGSRYRKANDNLGGRVLHLKKAAEMSMEWKN